MRQAGIDFTLLDSDVDLTRFFSCFPNLKAQLHTFPLTNVFEPCVSHALKGTIQIHPYIYLAEPSRKRAATDSI